MLVVMRRREEEGRIKKNFTGQGGLRSIAVKSLRFSSDS